MNANDASQGADRTDGTDRTDETDAKRFVDFGEFGAAEDRLFAEGRDWVLLPGEELAKLLAIARREVGLVWWFVTDYPEAWALAVEAAIECACDEAQVRDLKWWLNGGKPMNVRMGVFAGGGIGDLLDVPAGGYFLCKLPVLTLSKRGAAAPGVMEFAIALSALSVQFSGKRNKLLRYRKQPLTGYSKPNPEGFKPTHKWHPIYRKRDESSEELWKRIADHLLDVDEFPREIDGVHVIAAIEGFLVTLDPRGWWPVLHPYSPNHLIPPKNERSR